MAWWSWTISCETALRHSYLIGNAPERRWITPAPNLGGVAAIDACKIDAFARLMNEKLDTADTCARKSYIHSIIDAVEVDDKAIRIIGSKDMLQVASADKQIENGNVRGFVRKWRAIQNKTANSYIIEITL